MQKNKLSSGIVFGFPDFQIVEDMLPELFIRVWGVSETEVFTYKKRRQGNPALHFVTAGESVVEIDGRSYHTSPGTLFLLPAQSIVTYQHKAEDEWKYSWCWLAGRSAVRILTEIGLDRINPVLSFQNHPAILEMVNAITKKFSSGNYTSLYPIRAAWELVDLLLECYQGGRNKHSMSTQAMAIRNYIESHPMQNVSVELIAREFRISRVSVYRIFKKAYGQNPKQYIDQLRFEKACQLLSNSQFNINEIAHLCGFGSIYSFSTAFRKRLGIAPSEWHKKGSSAFW